MTPELLQEMLNVSQPVNDTNDDEWNQYFDALMKVANNREDVDLFMHHHMTRFDTKGELKKATLTLFENWKEKIR